MASKAKKILVTTESHEIFIVRRGGQKSIQGFCSECQKEVEMLMLNEATSQTGKRTRELFRLIENDLIHSTETTDGHLLVCRDSLEKTDGQQLIHKN